MHVYFILLCFHFIRTLSNHVMQDDSEDERPLHVHVRRYMPNSRGRDPLLTALTPLEGGNILHQDYTEPSHKMIKKAAKVAAKASLPLSGAGGLRQVTTRPSRFVDPPDEPVSNKSKSKKRSPSGSSVPLQDDLVSPRR